MISAVPMLFPPSSGPAGSTTPEIAPSAVGDDSSLRDAKIITIVVIGIASLLASLVPWLISRKCVRHADYIFSCLNVLSGGVVLGAALSHLMPDADEHFRDYYGEENEYPFMSLYAGSSLLVLWLIERLLLGNHSHSIDHDHNHENEADEETPIPIGSTAGLDGEIVDLNQVEKMPRSDIQQLTHLMKPFIEAIVFLIALSMHSLFEGLGLGAENDTKGVFTTIVAVASHKALEAFALGLAIHRAKLATWKSMVLIVLYALATPIGGVIGLVASHLAEDGATKVVSGILVSLAAGSFLYISLIEILPKELGKPTSRPKVLVKLFLMLFGWAFMVFIAKFA